MNMSLKMGIITAAGTGTEVTGVLKHLLTDVSRHLGIRTEFMEFGYTPKTFVQLSETPEEKSHVERKECADLVDFCREAYSKGFHTIFQTATNAGTLYQQRMHTEMLKIMEITPPTGKILLAREQSQGFYAMENKKETSERIEFKCSYTREKLYRTFDAAIMEADRQFGDTDYPVRFVYKFHLFDQFLTWITDYIDLRGLRQRDILVVQPDTGYDHLMRTFPRDPAAGNSTKILYIVGNEIGDIMTEALPNHYGIGDKATMFGINISLDRETHGQVIYQTIHGSADDLAGQNRMNPFSTIRAAAHILETRGGIGGIRAVFEKGLLSAVRRYHVTPDLGGDKTTTEVTEYILEYVLGHDSGAYHH